MTTRRRNRTVALLIAGCVVALGASTFVASAEAGEKCHRVKGKIYAAAVAEGCTSPVGLCTEGTVTGGGRLNGLTAFTTYALVPSAGMPAIEPPTEMSYSGELTLKGRRGDLHVRDLGIFSVSREKFTELARVVGGTGRFEGAYGTFFISGDLVDGGTAFSSRMHGEFCVP